MLYKIAILALVALTSSALAKHPCACTRNLTPVCGSDGNTYSNICMLECKVYTTGKDITVVKNGRCESDCVCPLLYRPVCGNDGKTYASPCVLFCERQKNPNINVVSEGACDNAVKENNSLCFCSFNVDEVCGSDGNTYENPCSLKCEKAKNPSLVIMHRGKCNE